MTWCYRKILNAMGSLAVVILMSTVVILTIYFKVFFMIYRKMSYCLHIYLHDNLYWNTIGTDNSRGNFWLQRDVLTSGAPVCLQHHLGLLLRHSSHYCLNISLYQISLTFQVLSTNLYVNTRYQAKKWYVESCSNVIWEISPWMRYDSWLWILVCS